MAFEEFETVTLSSLESSSMVYHRNDRKECKRIHVMNDQVYNDSINLFGLKKYLKEFSNMKEKAAMDVKLWDEYLIFACLFGMTKKVAKQISYMYPELVKQMENSVFDYDVIKYVDDISTKSVSISNFYKNVDAISSMASNYSSGGGGFSSGGGGGGSFGGGGGGSR